jgi:asparagine synthase (glutamine-hydrolysing)
MCGFVGLVHFDQNHLVDRNLLISMNNVQHHRGPDEDGIFIESNIGLAFKRLSIIDLVSGQQPMKDHLSECWIVFNGEIYNFKELKTELLAKGYLFNNESDTEVILNCYKEYGENCVKKLRGMFSFVIWDKRKNSLFLARDRFGIKPLHYIVFKNGIAFSSELKALLKGDFSKRQVNYQAIDSFFTYGYILTPNTIYDDIKKLPAAHTLQIDLDQPFSKHASKKYWQPTFSADKSLSFEDSSSLLIAELRDSVDKHLISDVPVGAFLSGGIDSNSVVALASQIYENRLKTFTIGFEEERFDESHLARIASKKYGTDHHELIIRRNSALELEKIIGHYDEPFNDSSSIPTYFVSKLAAEHVKVVLSGDGGDEFFGGYNSYRRLLMMRKLQLPSIISSPIFSTISRMIPSHITGKRFAHQMAQNPKYYYAFFNTLMSYARKDFFNGDWLHLIEANPIQKVKMDYIDRSNSDEYLSKMMELDILTYLTDDILTKVDRASMAHSLEVRVPIIDHEFFAFAGKVPVQHKIKKKTGKYVFRESMKKFLPEEIYSFPKRGFTIPISRWFKEDLNDFIADNLDLNGPLSEFLNKSYIKKLKCRENLGSMIIQVWPIVVFNQWLKNQSIK